MGFKFRKSFKIAPGVRVSFGKKSSSISFGTKGFRTSFNTKGRTTTSIGIPGTGLSYSKSTSLKGKSKSKKNKVAQRRTDNRRQAKKNSIPKFTVKMQNHPKQNVTPQYSAKTYKVCGIIAMVLAVPVVLLSLLLALVDPSCLILTAISIAIFIGGLRMKKKATVPQQDENTANNMNSVGYVICEACNNHIEKDARFCTHCGAVVNHNK